MDDSEGRDTERRAVWDDGCLCDIAAFANGDGGTILIGADDPESSVKEISNIIIERLHIEPDIHIVRKGNSALVEIDVRRSPLIVVLDGRLFERREGVTREVQGPELVRLIRSSGNVLWTDMISDDRTAKQATFSERTLDFIAERAGSNGVDEPIDLMSHFGLLEDGRMTKAAVLLMADDPCIASPDAYVKIGKFTEDKILIAESYIRGPLVMQVDEVVDVLSKKYLEAQVRRDGEVMKIGYEYPIEALREFVANAVVHRDYSVPGPIEIRLYPDRIEVFNPGRLPRDWTASTLDKSEHGSAAPNRRIFATMRGIGTIEGRGVGIRNAIELCQESGNGKPRFDTRFEGVRVTIDSRDPLGEMVDVGLRDAEAGRGMPAHEAIDMIRKRNHPCPQNDGSRRDRYHHEGA